MSIPLALLFNIILEGVLVGLGIPGVEAILQQWAAILSKLASDVVGGTIEALADRSRNLQARFSDFRTKLGELFELSARLELLVPEENLVELLRTRHSFLRVVRLRKSKACAALLHQRPRYDVHLDAAAAAGTPRCGGSWPRCRLRNG